MDDDARFDSTDTKRTLSQNLIAGVLCAFLCPVLANQGVAERRAVTVTDTIQMSKFANPIGENLEDVVEFSPDRRKFVVVIRKGDIAANLIRYSMLLWTLDGSNASQSNVLATMSSSSNRPGIERVSWLDNSTVVFLGEGPGQSHQLYSLDVTTGKMAQLTKHSTNILYYAVTRSGRTIAFVAESASQPLFNESALRNGLIVDDKRRLAAGVDNLISGQVGGALSYPELYVQTAGGKSKRIPTHGVIQMFGGGTHIALSPGGGYLVMTLRVENAPVEWQEYSNAWIQRAAKEPVPDGGYSALMTYVLINTETGENRALLNVPVGFGFKVAWSPDGNAVVIGETFLPLATTAGVERQTRRSQTVAAEIAVRDGRATVISSDNLRLDTWDPDTGCVWFERGSTLDFAEGRPAATREKVCFKKRNGNWAPVPMKPGNHMEIAVEQDSNTSPRLYAAQEGTRSKFLLFDPNPQFQGLKFGKVEAILD